MKKLILFGFFLIINSLLIFFFFTKDYKNYKRYDYISVVCPRLNPFASDPIVITSLNQYELRLSTYDRTPGTEVTLTCVDDLQIQGQSVITCQDDGNWNFESRPYCASKNMPCYITLIQNSNIYLKNSHFEERSIPMSWIVIHIHYFFKIKNSRKWKKNKTDFKCLKKNNNNIYISFKNSCFSWILSSLKILFV